MKHKRIFFSLMFLFILFFSTVAYSAIDYVCLNLNYDGKTHQYVEQKVTLKINGKEMKNLTMPPIIINNLTLVPAREVFQEVGATVDWDKSTYKVTVNYNGKKVVLKIGDKNATINGSATTMSTPAKIINNKTMIPLRFVSTSIGLNVSWNASSRIAEVTGAVANQNSSSAVTTITPLTAINSVSTPTDYNGGTFVIKAGGAIDNMKSMLLSGNRLVVDLYNSEIKTNANSIDVSNFAVMKVRLGQSDTVARVVFDLNSEHKYTVKMADDKKSVTVSFVNNSPVQTPTNTNTNTTTNTTVTPSNTTTTNGSTSTAPTISNNSSNIINSNVDGIKYDNYNTSVIINKKGNSISLNDVQHVDSYNSRIYKVILKGNYTGFLKDATINVNDHNFSTIKVDVDTASTIVTFNEKSILAYNISEDNENIYISAVQPKAKYKNIVVLDAGHGGDDPGACSQGYQEKAITLDIVNRVIALLEKDDNIKGYATRTTDVYPSFNDRTNLGNSLADVFVSVHINSASSEKANGTEVYYYSGADVVSARGISSSTLASTLQKHLLAKLGSYDRKVKREDFKVVRDSKIPSSLCEIGFITNVAEGAKLNSPEYRQLAAEAIYDALKELFAAHPKN